MSRCAVCGNRSEYCSCRTVPSATLATPADPDGVEKNDYEKQREAIVRNRWSGSDAEPTPLEFVMAALKYNPEEDGLYLCLQCGVTWDHECGYGGWHSQDRALNVTLTIDEEATGEPAGA